MDEICRATFRIRKCGSVNFRFSVPQKSRLWYLTSLLPSVVSPLASDRCFAIPGSWTETITR